MGDFTIEELVVPEALAGPGAADFSAAVAVRNVVMAHATGYPDLDHWFPEELLPIWRNEHSGKRGLIARVPGRVVARAVHELRPPAGRTAQMSIEVLPEFRGQGIGQALYERMLELSRQAGRSVLQCWAVQRATGGPVLPSPTGFGAVPADTAVTRFLLERGFVLGQVDRISRLALPLPAGALQERFAAAAAAAGDAYRLLQWTGRTPERHLAGIATLRQRMSTDAPAGGLDVEEEPWTAERVRSEDDSLADSPRTQLTVVAEHVPTGVLAGFTELSVPAEPERPVQQGDTLVLREHRGHRLGLLLKAANLLRLTAEYPRHGSVVTWNAEENRPMLAVNEALGFVPVGYEGAWEKRLD